MTLTEIETEIPKLTLEERLRLIRRLADDTGFVDERTDEEKADDALWDAQLREDGKPGGKLARMREKAQAEYKRGETEVWP